MKRVGIRSKIILLTLLILGGGFFVAPEILEEVAEVRYRRTLENGRANLAEALEKDYRKLLYIKYGRFKCRIKSCNQIC